jgi:UDP-N-acetylglucosamine acyltransferase
MAHSHVGHDCVIGDRVTLANQVSLAGHVQIGSGVTCGGHSAVHQFVHIGDLAFIAANAMVSRDIPPFCMASGDRATLTGINATGLKRNNLDEEIIREISRAYRSVFRIRDGLRTQRVLALVNDPLPLIRAFATFIHTSKRGVARHRPLGPKKNRTPDSESRPLQ